MKIKLLSHVRHVTNNLRAEHGSSETTAVGEKANALRLAGVEGDVAEQAGQAGVDGGGVHVTTESGNIKAGLHTLSEALLGQTHESLLDVLVSERLAVVQIAQLRSDFSESGVGGVLEEIVVKHTAVRLLDQLAGRGVEKDIVKAVQRSLGFIMGHTVGSVLSLFLQRLLASGVGLVASINSLSVALKGVLTVNNGVFAGEIRLVEIVGVGDVRATKTGLKDNRGIRTNEEGNTASTTSRASRSLGIQSNVTADNNGISSIPGGRLKPVDAVEDSVGTSIASVDVVNTLNVEVSALGKELHQNGLDGLGFVQESLSTDFETTNGLGVDVVFAKEGGESGQGDRVDIYKKIYLANGNILKI